MVGIYKITNPIGQVYIGQSSNINKRFEQHRFDCKHYEKSNVNTKLQTSFNLHGIENHLFEVLEVCEKSKLNEREIYFQNKFNSVKMGLNGVNASEKCKYNRSQEDGFVSKLLKLDPEAVKGLSLQAIEKGITFKRHAENILTEASLTDTQHIEAYYNKGKDTFTPISQISRKLQSDILKILNRK